LRRFGVGLVGSVATVVFVAFRAAVFNASLMVRWSPLRIDDASFPAHLVSLSFC
jgi:hypothetical protein